MRLEKLLRWLSTPHNLGQALLDADRVLDGLLVEAQGAPDMTVKVSAGVVSVKKLRKYVAANAALAIGAADATNPRIDLVTVDDTGALAVVAGTPAASPKAPDLPSGSIELARVDVPATDTTIAQSQISYQKRDQI